MRLVDGDAVDALATNALGLGAARETARLVAGGRIASGRVQTGDDAAWIRVLVGLIPELDLIGYKEFHRVGKRVRYHISLFRHSDGDMLGIVDGRRITSLRTASTAALAFDHALGGEHIRLAVVGSGEEAREGLRAVAGVTNLDEVRVYSPAAENRSTFARELGAELNVAIVAVDSVQAAVDGADAAYVATAARSPVVTATDTCGLRLMAAVGATRPDHHELSRDVVIGAPTVVVDCADALEEPGDMIDARRHGWGPDAAVLLGHWLQDAAPESTNGPILFKSIGSVEQDLVLARHILSAAEDDQVGRSVAEVGTLRMMR